MYYRIGNGSAVVAWSADPGSGSSSGGSSGGSSSGGSSGSGADAVTVNEPSPLEAGNITITGKETNASDAIYLDWRTYGIPVVGDSDSRPASPPAARSPPWW